MSSQLFSINGLGLGHHRYLRDVTPTLPGGSGGVSTSHGPNLDVPTIRFPGTRSGVTKLTKLHDGAKRYDDGATFTNSTVKIHFDRAFTARAPAEAIDVDQIHVIVRPDSEAERPNTQHEIMSLRAWKRYMQSDAGIREYGDDTTAERIRKKFSFLGLPITKANPPAERGEIPSQFINFNVAKWAKTPDIWQAYEAGDTPGLPDPVVNLAPCWMVIRKFSVDVKKQKQLAESERLFGNGYGLLSAGAGMDLDYRNNNNRFYWDADPWRSTMRADKPPAYLYTTEDWMGGIEFIGSVNDAGLDGNNPPNPKHRELARTILEAGSVSESDMSTSLLNAMCRVDLMLRVV